nr:MAG TPA: hypothetical protein [Caudoviricetes sp.]
MRTWRSRRRTGCAPSSRRRKYGACAGCPLRRSAGRRGSAR